MHVSNYATRSRTRYNLDSVSDKMPMGKYKGRLIKDVIETDPKYFSWMMERSNVKVSTSVRQTYGSYEFLAR